jgi:hypothetical protein
VAHVGGAEQEDRRGDHDDRGQRATVLAHRIAFDAAAVFERAHLLDRVLDQLPDQGR